MKKLICLLLTIGYLLTLSSATAKAETVTGGHALGGMSLAMEKYLESGQRFYSEDDLDLLSEVIFHENFCNGDYIMRLTGSVVLNRVASEGFPNTIEKVLYQPGQYSTTKMFFSKQIPDSVRQIAKELLIFGSIAPQAVVFQSMFPQGSGIYYVENGEYFCY